MTRVKIAKNLLKNKTCNNCHYRIDKHCMSPVRHNGNVEESPIVLLPNENTCERWQKTWEITFKTIPLTVKPKKLKIKWTMESELEIIK